MSNFTETLEAVKSASEHAEAAVTAAFACLEAAKKSGDFAAIEAAKISVTFANRAAAKAAECMTTLLPR